MNKEEERKTISANRKARHDYAIEEVYDAGIVLVGTEVKSIRAGRVNLQDSFVRIEKGEALLYHMYISPYEQGQPVERGAEAHEKAASAQAGDKPLDGQVSGERIGHCPALWFTWIGGT